MGEFAEYLDFPYPTVNHWMNGRRKPGPENAFQLAIKLGLEVYDALDLPRPNPLLFAIQSNIGLFTELEEKRIAKIIEDARARNEKSKEDKRI